MFCKKCGKQMEENWSVCPECGEPVKENNIINASDNGNNKKVKKPIFKKWWFWVVIVVLGSVLMFSDGDESESNDTNSDTKTESTETVDTKTENTEITDTEKSDAVEKYKWIAQNANPEFVILEKSINYIKEHSNFFPGNESIQGAISDFVDWEITYAHLTKSMSKYGDKLISLYGEVTDIEESEDGEITTVYVMDYDGNVYMLYYLGTLDNVFAGTYISAYALPVAIITYENMGGFYTEAVVGAACYVEEPVS